MTIKLKTKDNFVTYRKILPVFLLYRLQMYFYPYKIYYRSINNNAEII
jgi:hypothetical protein